MGNNLPLTWDSVVEATGLEPANLLTASQALYQLSYAPERFLPIDRTPSYLLATIESR